MDQALTQIIILGLASAVVSLAGIIFKMLKDDNAKKDARIAEQDTQADQQRAVQDATTKTLQAVVDVGMERLRAQQPPEPKP